MLGFRLFLLTHWQRWINTHLYHRQCSLVQAGGRIRAPALRLTETTIDLRRARVQTVFRLPALFLLLELSATGLPNREKQG